MSFRRFDMMQQHVHKYHERPTRGLLVAGEIGARVSPVNLRVPSLLFARFRHLRAAKDKRESHKLSKHISLRLLHSRQTGLAIPQDSFSLYALHVLAVSPIEWRSCCSNCRRRPNPIQPTPSSDGSFLSLGIFSTGHA